MLNRTVDSCVNFMNYAEKRVCPFNRPIQRGSVLFRWFFILFLDPISMLLRLPSRSDNDLTLFHRQFFNELFFRHGVENRFNDDNFNSSLFDDSPFFR